MTAEIGHSLILISTIFFAFIFAKSSLATYDLQLTALLFIILFIAKRLKKGGRLLEAVIFTAIIFVIVNTTGGVGSPFFFLLYFLLFSLSLLLEPAISITTTITSVAFFLLSLPPDREVINFLPIFSLAFLTPFALFMGQEYLKEQRAKKQLEKTKKDTFLFLSLTLKNNLKTIKHAVENFMGDHDLKEIERSAKNMEKMIEKFEEQE